MRSDIDTHDKKKHYYHTRAKAIKALREKLRQGGFTPSGGCWHDEETVCVFSKETWGHKYYNHPKRTYTATVNPNTGFWESWF